MKRRIKTALPWLWLSLVVVILDQVTKLWVYQAVEPYQSMALFPGMNVALVFNQGAAFSFLSQAGGWQRWVLTGFATIMCGLLGYWLSRTLRSDRWLAIGFALILGGALGNVLDRIFYGYVIDFIDFYVKSWHWYTFNIADLSITIGVLLLGLDLFKKRSALSNKTLQQPRISAMIGAQQHIDTQPPVVQSIRAENFRRGGVQTTRDLKAAQQNIANAGHRALGIKVPALQDEYPQETVAKASNLSEGPGFQQHAEAHPIISKSARFHNNDDNTAPTPDSPQGQKELELRYNPSPTNRPGAAPERKSAPEFKPPGT